MEHRDHGGQRVIRIPRGGFPQIIHHHLHHGQGRGGGLGGELPQDLLDRLGEMHLKESEKPLQ